jgi:autophagy-related protein 13
VASSGSFAADDDNISEFLKALDSRRTLKSFEPNKKGESLASKRTAAQLSKFQSMRETNNVLTDSMTSSIHLHRSSSSSSRQLTNVPTMVNPASMSVSSSPGKPLSPHTPHTPAIPSRLSENSIIDYQTQDQASSAHHQGRTNPNLPTPSEEGDLAEEEVDEDDDNDETPMVTQQDTSVGRSTPSTATENPTTNANRTGTATSAIDIPLPLSPRLLHLQQQHLHHHNTGGPNRRASSVAHPQHAQHRSVALGEASGGAAVDVYQRSASVEGVVGADGREVPSLSSLLAGYQREGHTHAHARSGSAAPEREGEGAGTGRDVGGDEVVGRSVGRGGGGGSSGLATRGSTGGSTRGVGRYVSAFASASPLGRGGRPGSFSSGATPARYAGSVEGADEEPLLFALSELARDSRRSLEEAGRSGGSAPAEGSGEGGKFEPRGILRKGW